MAHVYREVHRTAVDSPRVVDEVRTTDGLGVAAQVVYFLGGIITAILGLRFVLSLLGANRGNAFASFIYNISHPFVAPFFGLFNYQEQIGVVRFEFETLIAILFWAFVTWMVVRLLSIGSRGREV